MIASARPVFVRRLPLAFAFMLVVGSAGCAKCGGGGDATGSTAGADVPPLGTGFTDTFDRATLGPDWETKDPGAYRIVDGELHVKRAHNRPLWLRRSLPHDVKIELSCTPLTPDIDAKIELFGDGQRAESDDDVARDAQYTASGYVLIFGGWRGQISTIVRQAEHQWQRERGVPTRRDFRATPGKKYRWVVTRKGGRIDWEIDGQPFLSLDDPSPLGGPGHDRFAFDGWEAEQACDDLTIQPL